MNSLISLIESHLVVIAASLAIFTFLFLSWNTYLSFELYSIKKRQKLFFSGKKISNLEELLINNVEGLRSLDKDIQELFRVSNQINNLALQGLFKVGFVRFNPFKDVGGDQSFAIALLNGKNNGIILSSLYSREGTRIYSKFIVDSKSEKHPLTDEERQAIKMAVDSGVSSIKVNN